MAWLAIHMWVILLAAFLLGLICGWWIWRTQPEPDLDGAEAQTPATTPAQLASTSTTPDAAAPLLYPSPTKGPADDLKKIKGIGPGIEKLLYSIGIYYYAQISAWSTNEVSWVDDKLQFPGRITRESWITQAKTLHKGDQTEFATRYEKGETPSSYHDGEKKPGK